MKYLIVLLLLTSSVYAQTISYNGDLNVQTTFEVDKIVIATQYWDEGLQCWVGYSVDILEYPQKVRYRKHIGLGTLRVILMITVKDNSYVIQRDFWIRDDKNWWKNKQIC